jgi:ABC-2 type transport system permease protein
MTSLANAEPTGRNRDWHVVLAFCQRDWRVHLRSPLAIFGTLAGPLLLLFAIGVGLGSTLGTGTERQIWSVLVPGLAAMGAVLVASQRSITVFTDHTSGLTDEILVGPVDVRTVVLAQTVSSTTIATLHALAVFGISAALGLATVPAHWVLFLFALVAFAFMCSASCNAMGLLANRPGSIQALLNMVVNPLFFLSGALFDVDRTILAMRIVALLNPLHYGVRLLQAAYHTGPVDVGSAALSGVVVIATASIAITVGARSLRRR